MVMNEDTTRLRAEAVMWAARLVDALERPVAVRAADGSLYDKQMWDAYASLGRALRGLEQAGCVPPRDTHVREEDMKGGGNIHGDVL